jgi:hypothetical protein
MDEAAVDHCHATYIPHGLEVPHDAENMSSCPVEEDHGRHEGMVATWNLALLRDL